MVKDIEVSSSGVTIHLAPSTAQPDMLRQIEEAVRTAVAAMPGIGGTIEIVSSAAPPPRPRGPQPIPGVASIVAVASGKGGGGKSTVATKLALALGSPSSTGGLPGRRRS